MSQGAAKVLAYAQGAVGSQTGVLDTGTLAVLDNQVDPTTGTIKLKATFPNAEQSAVAGRLRRRAAAGGHREGRRGGAAGRRAARAAQHLCLRGRTRTTRRRAATSRSGTRTRRRRIITEGVKPGDKVVIDGASRLTDDSKVTIVPADAARAAVRRPPGSRLRRERGGAAAGAPGAD